MDTPKKERLKNAVAEWVLINPTITHRELITKFKMSALAIQTLLHSEDFRERLDNCRARLVDPSLAQALNDRIKNVTLKSLDLVAKRLETNPSAEYALSVLQMVQTTITPIYVLPKNSKFKRIKEMRFKAESKVRA